MPPNRVLYLLRHAKSSWDDPGIEDHERPLAPRGRRAARVLADHVHSAGIMPELVLCSSARRTRETLEGVDPPGQWQIESELYAASPGTVLARLQSLPDDVRSAMVVGHNPTMQVLVLRLAAAAASEADLEEVQRKFPTGALATLTFEGGWSELAPGRARLASYVRPRQLEGR
ncbi:MAG TPA: histidine phosphatase family protein [Solirubrobacteraceae bacterium]|nr:histidine phosphatase family protein [Solirubrobacteraceae bacterium]